jgi:hypothetical protein
VRAPARRDRDWNGGTSRLPQVNTSKVNNG